jgi:hypothetical protein
MTGRDRLRPALLLFWLLPAAVATLGLRLVPSRLNPELTLLEIILAQLLIWLPWGAWTLLIAAVQERVPFERGNAWRAIGVHLLLSPLVVMAQILVIWHIAVEFGMNEPRGLESRLFIGLRQYGDLLMVVYWAVVGTLAGLRWRDRWLEETVQAARLREDLAQANLQALRAQLNPHFLFNALNAVVTLIGRDQALARDTVVRLADLLRATLSAGDAQETTLAQELELTARYLEIEELRFADRLTVQWRIEPDLNSWRVPAFALQPLVENALKHGLARRRAPGIVEISARRDGDVLELIVRDDGADADASPVTRRDAGAGIALTNLRARLARLYGAEASLALRTRPEGGMDAVVRIPGPPPASS